MNRDSMDIEGSLDWARRGRADDYLVVLGNLAALVEAAFVDTYFVNWEIQTRYLD